MDVSEPSREREDRVNLASHEERTEDDFTEALAHGCDDDAVYVMDFEAVAADVIQSDEELASAYTTYVDARRKLSEKFRSRGFWPVGKGKKGSSKGKLKSKSSWSSGKKSLQQRILDSHCRLCGRKGHWKSECPQRSQSSSSTPGTATVTLSLGATPAANDDAMPMEFMELPEITEEPIQGSPNMSHGSCVQLVFSHAAEVDNHSMSSRFEFGDRSRMRAYFKGNVGSSPPVASLVNRIGSKLRQTSAERPPLHRPSKPGRNASVPKPKGVIRNMRVMGMDATEVHVVNSPAGRHNEADVDPANAKTMSATHDTWGIIDTGATKTVIGSEHVAEFLQALDPQVKQQVKRCKCEVTFRFGNKGVLKSQQALFNRHLSCSVWSWPQDRISSRCHAIFAVQHIHESRQCHDRYYTKSSGFIQTPNQ